MATRVISQTNIKKLFADSGGICAFPNCNNRLVDKETGALLGEMCHISAVSIGGPRYNSSLTEEERNSIDNMIIFCPNHHSLIDQSPNIYTTSKLLEIKKEHEQRVSAIIENVSIIEDKQAASLIRQVASESVDFGILVALPRELKAILHNFPELVKDSIESNVIRSYYTGQVKTDKGGFYRIVVTLLHSMGNLEAAHATSDLINRWNPRYIIVNGIAAGINRTKQKFGDIIVSSSILYYEGGKINSSGIENRIREFNSDPSLLDSMLNFLNSNWNKNFPDFLEHQNNFSKGIKIHVGPIASGEKVIASRNEVERLVSSNTKLIGIEMESAGVASASFSSIKRIGFLTIRSICDFADEKKDNSWQDFAAYSAAACLKAYLQSKPVPFSEGSWPTVVKNKVESKPVKSTTLRKELFDKLCSAFNMEDFKNFCFLIGVDIDELPGDTKSGRVRELILLFERKNEIEILSSAISEIL